MPNAHSLIQDACSHRASSIKSVMITADEAKATICNADFGSSPMPRTMNAAIIACAGHHGHHRGVDLAQCGVAALSRGVRIKVAIIHMAPPSDMAASARPKTAWV